MENYAIFFNKSYCTCCKKFSNSQIKLPNMTKNNHLFPIKIRTLEIVKLLELMGFMIYLLPDMFLPSKRFICHI